MSSSNTPNVANNSAASGKDALNLPNRPPPQQIPNTPFLLYPAANGSKSSNTSNTLNACNSASSAKSVESVESDEKTGSKSNIVEIDFEASNKLIEAQNGMNRVSGASSTSSTSRTSVKSVQNDGNKNSKQLVPRLANDLNQVLFEIEQLHKRIFHLRRTNKEIKEFYNDDVDCKTAYEENIVVIEKFLQNLFVYFDLFKELTKGQIHKLEKLYETDRKVNEKFENIGSKSIDYMMPQTSAKNDKNDKNDKTDKQIANVGKDEHNEKSVVDDRGMSIDADGGLTL